MLSFFRAVLFASALAFSIAPERAAADADPFDFPSFVRCGQVACAHVYQGEGVDHPQLIVDLWRQGAGLNSPNYIYIWDFPNDGPLTASFYINSHLAQRTGGPQSLTLSDNDLLSMLPDGEILAEGLELGLNAPYTAHLGFWPGPGALAQIIAESYDALPQSILDWDDANGFGPEGDPPGRTPTGNGSSHAASTDFLPSDSCIAAPETCGIFLTGVGNVAQSLQTTGQATAQVDRTTTETALRARVELDRERFARVAGAGLNRPLDLTGIPRPTGTAYTSCAAADLESEPDLGACKDRCDTCALEWNTGIQTDAALQCTGAITLVAIFGGPETLGVTTLVGGAALFLGAAGGCAWLALLTSSAQQAAMDQACNTFCDHYWGEDYADDWD